jgi:succinyl-CoA synthetase beta subunit
MDLYEYQAKELFARHGVPVPRGRVASTPQEARMAAEELKTATVIKAQVKTGGRGKAGGVRPAPGPASAEAEALRVLGMDIKGHTARTVLVEQATVPFEEYYAAYLVDRANRTFLAMVSSEGGMDIEEVAATRPEALARMPVDPAVGVDRETARLLAGRAGLPEEVQGAVADVLVALWRVLVEEDALLVEVNPLACTSGGRVLALDGKVTLDDNAAFRHDH